MPKRLQDVTLLFRANSCQALSLLERKIKLEAEDTVAGNRRHKNCTHCGQTMEFSGEWYRDLCPACADETEGKWVCRYCKREGNFEEMGGSGVMNPICCGSLCDQIKTECM